MEKKQLGGLTCYIKRGQPNAPWVVMLHGYGADAMDLAPLHQILPQRPDVNWLFPEAPLLIPFGPHHVGRAWFELRLEGIDPNQEDMEKLKNLIPEEGPKGLAESLELLTKALSQIDTSGGVVLSGFSQGSMVALEWLLTSGHRPKGLMIFSGAPVITGDLKGRIEHLKGLKFFQSHGTEDPVLPYQGACMLHRELEAHGLSGEFLPFQGGHTIAPEAIRAVNRYLQQCLA
jgi:phospholipase/carboxylesterase